MWISWINLLRYNHNFCDEYYVTTCWYVMNNWKSLTIIIWYGQKKSDLMTGGPWYHTYICKKLHGKLFEGFIINARTDRYHIMCSIDAYEKEHQSSSCDDARSGRGCPLPTNSTAKAL